MYPISCILMRRELNHKQEICNLFWSTFSCKLFTTLQYCLVLSESLMATQFYVVEFPSEDEKCRGPYLVPANKVKQENGTTHVLWSVVALWRYTMNQHASRAFLISQIAPNWIKKRRSIRDFKVHSLGSLTRKKTKPSSSLSV